MVNKLLDTSKVVAAPGQISDITPLNDVRARLQQWWWGIIESREALKFRIQASRYLARSLGMSEKALSEKVQEGAGLAMLLRMAAQAQDEPGKPRNG